MEEQIEHECDGNQSHWNGQNGAGVKEIYEITKTQEWIVHTQQSIVGNRIVVGRAETGSRSR